MHTVLSQGKMEVTGETVLSQLQPAADFLQIAEQGEAEGGAGRGRLDGHLGDSDFGDLGCRSRFWWLNLHFFPFIGWKNYDYEFIVEKCLLVKCK